MVGLQKSFKMIPKLNQFPRHPTGKSTFSFLRGRLGRCSSPTNISHVSKNALQFYKLGLDFQFKKKLEQKDSTIADIRSVLSEQDNFEVDYHF